MPRRSRHPSTPSDRETRAQGNAGANRGPTPGSQLDSGEGLPDSHVATPGAPAPDASKKTPRELPPHHRDQHDDHEGATESEVGDRTGPGAGYDVDLPDDAPKKP